MTHVRKVYDAFLAKMLDDEWADWDLDEIKTDWKAMLMGALPWFKFPRVSLEIDEEEDAFVEDLNNEEI